MSTINTNIIEEDEVPTAAELNKPYDDLATASAAVGSDNIASGAITRKHMLGSGFSSIANNVYSSIDFTASNITDITSTSYVTLARSGVPQELTLGYAADVDETLRIKGNGLVSNTDVVTVWDYVGANLGKNGLYAFRLLLYYNVNGGGTLTTTIGEWGYSFATNSSTDRYDATATSHTGWAGIPIAWQTFQFEGTYLVSQANVTLEKVALQAKVFSSSNTLRIRRNSIISIRARR
jgi:hypothetical protein